MRTSPRRLASIVVIAAAAVSLSSGEASAHADADVVAVAAGEEATINFRPNHGCDGSPTIEVAVRVPVSGATGGDVEGWTSTAEPDGEGRTVVEWTGGSLPDDVTGAFPVTFEVPDTVGELLLFPAVQTCENGDEWSWLNGDPASDNPIPRLLVLAPGSPSAASIDQVPQGAAGRELLTAVVDTTPTTTTTAGSSASTALGEESTTTTTTSDAPDDTSGESDDSSGGAGTLALVLVVGPAAVLLAGGFYLWRRER